MSSLDPAVAPSVKNIGLPGAETMPADGGRVRRELQEARLREPAEVTRRGRRAKPSNGRYMMHVPLERQGKPYIDVNEMHCRDSESPRCARWSNRCRVARRSRKSAERPTAALLHGWTGSLDDMRAFGQHCRPFQDDDSIFNSAKHVHAFIIGQYLSGIKRGHGPRENPQYPTPRRPDQPRPILRLLRPAGTSRPPLARGGGVV